MAKIDEYMLGFSKEVGLDIPMSENLPGVYVFGIGDDVAVSVVDKNDKIAISASFGPMPEQQKEAFYTDLLTADLFYQGTERSILGINSAENKVVVKKIIDHEMDDKEFTDEMEDFLNTLTLFRERVAQFR